MYHDNQGSATCTNRAVWQALKCANVLIDDQGGTFTYEYYPDLEGRSERIWWTKGLMMDLPPLATQERPHMYIRWLQKSNSNSAD